MGTARSVFFTVSSILMLFSGAGLILLTVLVTLERYDSPGALPVLTLICAAAALISAILNFISGISGVRSYNRRTNSAVVIRLPEISILLCLASIVLSLFNGILYGNLLIEAGIGILIPGIFIFSAIKKSYTE
ncbi:MAG: hypothetical protein IJ106_15945 [Parasporobacterium sp.]|nr:hypothetical protein [Parasporobacterium sp.]